MKARFEEAKTREFAATRLSLSFPRRPLAPHGGQVTTPTPSLVNIVTWWTVNVVTREEKLEKTITEERIAELKQELQKAELAAAIEEAGTLNTMETTPDSPDTRLGLLCLLPLG